MAITESKTRWAMDDETAPISGLNNKQAIPTEFKNSGLKENQALPRQYFNQLMHDQHLALVELQRQISNLVADANDYEQLLERIWQVNDIWITQTTDNPATRFGFGTWEKIDGRFLVSSSASDTDFSPAKKQGGQKKHGHSDTFDVMPTTLTVNQIPSHSHTYVDRFYPEHSDRLDDFGGPIAWEDNPALGDAGSNATDGDNDKVLITTDNTENTGGGGSHDHTLSGVIETATHLPPYEVFHVWRRTA
ncbi:putative minor structural protein [Pseudoalteromonas phage J2-1_QLiu-2017]|nr:putative minor structural protein [Pseudoalteromonas phage J2-1_QLiu-2017]